MSHLMWLRRRLTSHVVSVHPEVIEMHTTSIIGYRVPELCQGTPKVGFSSVTIVGSCRDESQTDAYQNLV